MLFKKYVILSLSLILFYYKLYAEESVFDDFIYVKDGKLYDGKREFRFVSFNIPNLLMIEDNMQIDNPNAWRLPNSYEIKDALSTIRLMGGNVARTYAITVRRNVDLKNTPKHVVGPGIFNEEAFLVLDTVLAIANEVGVRLIIPFVDNWKWMGGKEDYASFRVKRGDEFWTDPEIKADFKRTIGFILNRKNTITGTIYKEDKAILAWELANEIWNAPMEWIEEMASFVKSIDSNHLVNDGRQTFFIKDDVINSPYIDILSTHHYEPNLIDMIDHIRNNVKLINGKKPYYIGEFGFVSTSAIKLLMDYLSDNKNVSGSLLWSLRFHNRDGGFYWHSEPGGGGLYKAYHWPGFHSGNLYNEIGILNTFAKYMISINGLDEGVKSRPNKPKLLHFDHPAFINWQGSAGAKYYVIERREENKNSWEVVAFNIDDASIPYYPQFTDETVEVGKSYYYRIKAVNQWGESEYSNTVGPICVKSKFLIDNCDSYGKMFFKSSKVKIVSDDARRYKEDFHRFRLEKGEEIVYGFPGNIKSFKIIAFTEKPIKIPVILSLSKDGKNYNKCNFDIIDFFAGKLDYKYCVPYIISNSLNDSFSFLCIEARTVCQIGRVEIEYE